jgi:hypothetical protein
VGSLSLPGKLNTVSPVRVWRGHLCQVTVKSLVSQYYVIAAYKNNAASGQYILGQPLNSQNRRRAARLRTVSELYPEIVDAAAGEDPLPSCSAIEALDRQEPFMNQTLASSALAMLARLFHYGKLNYHGAFFNSETGRMSALPIDPQMWTKVRRRNRRLRVAA